MLRARVLRRSDNYVCDLCRRKLSIAGPASQCRSKTPSHDPATVSQLSISSIRHSHARFFSATRTLGNTDGSGPKFGLGAGLRGQAGGFGGFGVKKAASEAPAADDGLLPHERAARQKTAPAPAPPPAPKKQSHRDRHQKGGKQTNRPKPQANTADQSKAEQSRSALTEIFKKSQQSRRMRTDETKSSTSNEKSEGAASKDLPDAEKVINKPARNETPAPAKTKGWGQFSARKANTTIDDTKSGHGKGSKNAPVADKAPGTKTSNPSSPKGFDAMMKGRIISQSTDAPEGDFWGDMEERVGTVAGKQQKALEQMKAELAAQPNWTDQGPQGEEEEDRPRRKSRFEMEEEEHGRGKNRKADKRKASKRGGYHEELEFDSDEDARRWEAAQRRKEEKRLRKLEVQDEPQVTPIFLPEYISVSNLSRGLKQPTEDFLRDLEDMGFENMSEDTIMTGDTASLIAMEYNFEPTVDDGTERDLRPRAAPEDISTLPSRPPIVTIMGHVDHGKTTLLDWLRKSSVAAQEHGGITQHIGAFVVKMSSGKPITFLDTPGHAAFLSMRQRGANVTDIVVLVVAADDSVKPQTLEALKHATNAQVPIIVAINKIDKEQARIEQVKSDLARHGVQIEDYGGDVQVVPVSGKTGQGMEDLEENIVTLSEILDTRSEVDGMAEGWVLESSIKQVGKVATVLIKRGTLRTGDFIVAGRSWARVRLLRNEAGVEMSEAPPGTPVEVLGWRDLPEAGEQVLQAPDEDKAKTAVEYREEMADRLESSAYIVEQEQRQREKAAADAAAEAAQAEEAGEAPPDNEPTVKTQNFVVKADVAGSVEAVCASVLEQGNYEVQSRILRSGTGQISEYDVDHAATSRSILVNFNSTVQPHIKLRATEAGVRIVDHSVIYHLISEVRDALSDLLPKHITQRVQGEADVLQIFPINIKGKMYKNIAGCRVRNGTIKKTSMVKVLRKGEVVFDGKIDTLKHVKKNVMEMGKGSECGIGFEGYQELEIDDQVQTYEVIEEKRHL